MDVTITTAGQANPGRLFEIARQYRVTTLVLVIVVAVFGLPSVSEWAAWHRDIPLGLQLWTAHFSHWSGGHLFWDLLTFVVLAAVIEPVDRRLLGKLLLIVPPVILATVWLMEEHAVYRGLSGIDCALYGAVAIIALRKDWIGPSAATLALVLFIGKSVFEIAAGQTLFVSDLPVNVTAVPWAHLSGAIAGIFLTLRIRHPLRTSNVTGLAG